MDEGIVGEVLLFEFVEDLAEIGVEAGDFVVIESKVLAGFVGVGQEWGDDDIVWLVGIGDGVWFIGSVCINGGQP